MGSSSRNPHAKASSRFADRVFDERIAFYDQDLV